MRLVTTSDIMVRLVRIHGAKLLVRCPRAEARGVVSSIYTSRRCCISVGIGRRCVVIFGSVGGYRPVLTSVSQLTHLGALVARTTALEDKGDPVVGSKVTYSMRQTYQLFHSFVLFRTR